LCDGRITDVGESVLVDIDMVLCGCGVMGDGDIMMCDVSVRVMGDG
jgi:hypothetical protein